MTSDLIKKQNTLVERLLDDPILFVKENGIDEMLSSFTKNPDYKVFHIDNLGLAQSHDDWYDELHLKRYMYKRVANAYEYIIRKHRSLGDRRIIRTKDL